MTSCAVPMERSSRETVVGGPVGSGMPSYVSPRETSAKRLSEGSMDDEGSDISGARRGSRGTARGGARTTRSRARLIACRRRGVSER
jgi:hypothetical protein